MKALKIFIRITVMIVGLMLFLFQAKSAEAQPTCQTDCGNYCALIPDKIALVTYFTGPFTDIGTKHRVGAELAVQQINRQGGSTRLYMFDGQGSPRHAFTGAIRAIESDNIKIVIGVFGKALAEQLAQSYPDVLVFDLGSGWSRSTRSNKRNVLALSNQFKQGDGRTEAAIGRSGCPDNTMAMQPYVAIQLIAEAAKFARTGAIRNIIENLHNNIFHTALGTIQVEANSNVFSYR